GRVVAGEHPGEALQDRIEALQQPALIAIAQGQLHLAPAQFEMDVYTRRCLWEGRGWDWGCWWHGRILGGRVEMRQPLLGQGVGAAVGVGSWGEVMEMAVNCSRQCEYASTASGMVLAVRNLARLVVMLVEAMARSVGAARLLDPQARWRTHPASDGQKTALTKWGVAFDPAITKGQASDMLGALFGDRALRPVPVR